MREALIQYLVDRGFNRHDANDLPDAQLQDMVDYDMACYCEECVGWRMNSALQYLCHLVHKKNDINRRRRRFYCIANPRYEYRDKPIHSAFTIESAKIGYEKAKSDMKALTQEMRQVRMMAGARLGWGSGGQINYIRLKEEYICVCRKPRCPSKLLAELHKADNVILGDECE